MGCESTSGPLGDSGLYAFHPRGRILLRPETAVGLYQQIAAVLAAGCGGAVDGMAMPIGLPASVAARLSASADGVYAAALVEGNRIADTLPWLAALPGAIVTAHAPSDDGYRLDALLEEASTSINTTAAGGNASLMMIG